MLLHPYLQEPNEERSRHLLAQLIAEEIDPVIKRVVGYRLSVTNPKLSGGWQDQQLQDLRGEVIVRLLTKLRDLKEGNCDKAIKDFRNYAAVVAHNICSEQYRRHNVQYSRLKDHIRYVLINQPGLALWEDEHHGWLGGYAVWREQRLSVGSRASSVSTEDLVSAKLNIGGVRQKSLAEQLPLIFNEAGRPVELTELIKIVATLRGIEIRNGFTEQLAPETEASFENHSPQPAVQESEVEQRLFLQKLWVEICKLPLPHRTALLLNLRDRESEDRGLIISLADLRIATIPQIAEALGLSPEKFAAIWMDLPWDDLRIAQHLEITRQKVINLRKTARKLLARRMKELTGAA
ncbi:MAG TPA: hypothetical protein VJ302_01570 [Blastocatellia bacterium]|nr:hypothetical protein [Blastocatellia bacterium]